MAEKPSAMPTSTKSATQAQCTTCTSKTLDQVFDAALKIDPQKIERRDSEAVVMVSESDWRRLATEHPTVADLILNCPI